MCTEPSAFGAKCSFHRNDLPYADKVIRDSKDIEKITVPDPRTDGLAPFVLNRLELNRKKIEDLGHSVYFAVARGPLNIASFLMGTTEFLMGLRTNPKRIHKLLEIVMEYTIEWLKLQKERFDTIDGIFILDDIVGFCGEPDFKEFAQPYLKQIFDCLDVSVKFFHNDADAKGCAPHLGQTGVNLFNFSFMHSLKEMKEWTNNEVALLGNIPPRDVLAGGTKEQIEESLVNAVGKLDDRRKIILSCGGGMPGGVSTENINTLCELTKMFEVS
jgi:uroporphyrinogen decarboxylase